ncbi:MAG: hypothetical protein LBO72_00660 [Helicobacteraceae bacterium]|nr:hypothetical protein [Helicobacteraceae bacterium]
MRLGSKVLATIVATIALVGCGGSSGDDDDSAGGGGSPSVADTYLAFPTFDESNLTVVGRQVSELYNYDSNETRTQFEASLRSKGFIPGDVECWRDYEFYKLNVKGSWEACVNIDRENFLGKDYDFHIFLGSDSALRGLTDSDIIDIFGEIPGTLFSVENGITVSYVPAAQNALSAYKSALNEADFTCDADFERDDASCCKHSGGTQRCVSVFYDDLRGQLMFNWTILQTSIID